MKIADLHIHYLKRQEIDIARWDECVTGSSNRLIYGFHFYLDRMTGGQWDALVAGDYQAVMPLTGRRKYGIRYLAQPAFTQQTGIFSPGPLPTQTVMAFITEAAKRFRFAEIFLNYGNSCPGLEARTNLVVSLDKPYESLAAAYSDNHRRNLRKSAGLQYTADMPLTEALDAWRSAHGHRNRATLGDEQYRRFDQLCHYAEKEKKLLLRAVTGDRGQRHAIAVLLRDASRLYLLEFTLLPAGREKAAGHFLIDSLIREFAGQPLLLDFEGSDDPGIARFYAGFGSIDQPYFFWRHNRLPWPLRLLKSSAAATPRPAQDQPE